MVASLQQLGVIAQPVTADDASRYLIGEAFLQLFSFMGCAPSIEFMPPHSERPDWDSFVFIHLSSVTEQARWLVDHDSAKPACPHCQRRTRDWMSHYQPESALIHCPHCQQLASVCDWRWYDAGACARYFISIVNVYPKEAMPTEALFEQLQQTTGVAWQYFYWQGPL